MREYKVKRMTDKEGVTIRDFRFADIPKKVEWINNSDNNTYLHYHLPLTYEGTCAWFDEKDNSVRRDCVIEADGVPVGLIGLLAIDAINRKAEFYISMGEVAYKRKGIAAAATRLMFEYAFCDLHLNKLYANVDAENEAACALYEKTGMRCEGFFREDLFHREKLVDRKRYAILKSDFEKEGLK